MLVCNISVHNASVAVILNMKKSARHIDLFVGEVSIAVLQRRVFCHIKRSINAFVER